MSKPTAMLLEANFDISQVGETLEWKFSRTDGNGNPLQGRYAGSIYFTVGEQMHVRVRAGSFEKFESFEVLDCCLITRPQIMQIGVGMETTFAEPSPFVDVVGASTVIPADEFVPSKVPETDPKYYEIAQKWKSHLTVGQITGRWEFSFALTVLITPKTGSPTKRVFVFDPEGEVGLGMYPPRLAGPIDDSIKVAMVPEGEIGNGMPT